MSAPPSASAHFWLGFRTFLPVAISIAAYGLVWGVLAGQAGLSVLEVALMSGLVFAGASQFVALDMWVPEHLPIVSIVVATAIINLRMVLMSATLRPLVAGHPMRVWLPATFFVTDETWAITMAAMKRGEGTLAFFAGTATLAWFGWVGATLLGRLLGSVIDDPTRYGLDFAFTATFLALLFGMWRGKADIVPWLVAALAAIATSRLVEGNWYIIVGGLAGSLAGALVETRRRRHVD